MANISRNVAALPSNVTSKRAIEKNTVAMAIEPPTTSSRTSTAMQNQRGAASSAMIATRATMNSRRSTVGSNFLPNSLTWPSRRARYPSTQSVAPSPPSSHAAAGRVVAAEQQVEEQRQAQQPQQGEQVRDRPAACRPRRRRLLARRRSDRPGDCTWLPGPQRTPRVRPMPTVFTRIIDGEIPGTFVWRDDRCVVFMSINPMARGHALVVPIEELDHWVDGDPDAPRPPVRGHPGHRCRPAAPPSPPSASA